MISVLRKLLGLFDRRTRLQFAVLLVPMLCAAILEMLSIGAVLPLLQVTTGGGGRLATLAAHVWPGVSKDHLVAYLGGVFVALFVFKNIGLLAVTWFINWFSDRKRAEFATGLFRVYLSKPYVFYLGRNTADILRELTQSVPLVFESLSLMMAAILEILLVVATIALLMMIELRLTLAAAFLLLAVGLAFNFGTQRRFSRWGQRVHAVDGQAIKTVVESLGAIREIKVLNCEERQIGQFSRALYELAHYRTLVMTAPHAPRLLVETVMVVGMVVILPMLMADHPIADLVSILGVFAMAALRLLPSMNRILVATSELRHRAARIEAIHEDMQASSLGLYNQTQPAVSAPPPNSGEAESKFSFEHEIRFENVGFVYPGRTRPALSGVDLRIPWGESLGMVGTSGAGKSTALDILIGLLAPSTGRVLVDGWDVADHMVDWQARIGHVPQHIYLMDDTLRANIAFGADAIDDDALAEAVGLSCLEDVIALLPQGLDTVVGENGYGLSGGQRQRVGIARALYRRPDLLVFDEATSALDNETERGVTAAIDRLRGMKTMVIVAHRLETIRECARIAFFRDGRLVAIDTFDALARENPHFRGFAGLDAARNAATL